MNLDERQREIAALLSSAEGALREDAPAPAAGAREQLLRMYRARFAEACRLNLEQLGEPVQWDFSLEPVGGSFQYVWSPRTHVAWEEADIEGLAWLCTLADAGHVGAARLADRLLANGRFKALRLEDSESFRALARRFPRVALYFIRILAQAEDGDPEALVAWLDCAGDKYASIAATLREIDDWRAQWRIVRKHVANAESSRETKPLDLLVDIGLARQKAQMPGAMALLSHAAQLGSAVAAEALWLGQYASDPDKAAFVRKQLAAGLEPSAASEEQAWVVAKTLEHEAGAETAAPWYVRAIGARASGADRAFLEDADFCYKVGDAYRWRWPDASRAVAWFERGMLRGSARCLEAWLLHDSLSRFKTEAEARNSLEHIKRVLEAWPGMDLRPLKRLVGSLVERADRLQAKAGPDSALASLVRELAGLLASPDAPKH